MKNSSFLSVAMVALVCSVAVMPTEANFFRSLMASATCDWTCATNCVKCLGSTAVDANTKEVIIDVGNCKDAAISWMCCKTEDCKRKSCNGLEDTASTKCDTVTKSTYTVPVGTTTLSVQIHDGKLAGNVDCSGGKCCGGAPSSCGTISGVCNIEVDLSTCPNTTPECTADADCGSSDASTCTKHVCTNNKCAKAPLPAGNVCRAASAGGCDVEEVCDGVKMECPVDAVAPLNQICRAAPDLCDVPEKCDGVSKDCPADAVAPSTQVCRIAEGVCDVEEKCDGKLKECPADLVAPTTTTCRPAAGTCDVEEKCDGKLKDCPADVLLPKDAVCRPNSNPCDVPEVCDGKSAECPEDVQQDKGKVFKCARTCYLCGIDEAKMVLGKGASYSLGSCGVGACDKFVSLKWPECVNQCVGTVCENNRGLSNIEHFTCDHSNGNWVCKNKLESPFTGAVCPSYTR